MSDAPHLSPQEDRTWSLLVGVMMWLPGALDAYLGHEHGLTHAEYQVLRWLSTSEESDVHMTQLAAGAGVTPSHLSRIVTRMEKKLWVTRRSDSEDARRTLARLTDAGSQAVDRIEPGYVQQVRRRVFEHLGPGRIDQLEQLAEAILTPLRQDCVHLLPSRTSPGPDD
ncbi:MULTISPECIES: MarR family winged helix-turn-helix transcriptional regulator [Rhodococcus]|uniref:MarR family winged helix-turn-helix transcriptional regulator n=1 Tax=Rhodococcus cerastii TaxID=908616 RepID=A0ABU4D1I0_9NOCA|nr:MULTISPECIES: MarR family winged helix-turn-helix transcriptional regulator [Rhodococcus]MDV6303577.1 MarR family winged helix-turn-helix transcriptional regulator [Rhodococcus cerastii]MDV7989166.1 MarR family winged helix-turn-helix transcriptional regulator [Rhodococcus sp. IEGM 1374]